MYYAKYIFALNTPYRYNTVITVKWNKIIFQADNSAFPDIFIALFQYMKNIRKARVGI